MRPPILDPRAVPVDPAAPDAALPALSTGQLTADALRRQFDRLNEPRPLLWQPEMVGDGFSVADALKPAAVLMPMVSRPEGLGLLLTVRSARLSQHPGQVAFPGGRVDASDASVEAAALRETHEEIGLEADQFDVLGRLTQYTTGTGYSITPVVALVSDRRALAHLRPQPAEVDEVFEVPLAFLMDPANHRQHLFRWTESGAQRQRHFFSMPWRPDTGESREYFIWGATAAMLRNLYRFLAAK